MRFRFCPFCGTETVLRQIGDEGEIPYCVPCARPLFDMFATCVLSVVQDSAGRLLLIRQSYGQQETFVGIAGYMKPGETAEEAAVREICEEVGLSVPPPEYLFSAWHERAGQLMLCFRASGGGEPVLSGEVREARYFTPEEALSAVRPGSIIERLVKESNEFLELQ